MKVIHFRPLRNALAIAGIAALAACASTPLTNPKLDEARAAYDRAAADAQVARSAPMELQRAQESLQRAESALRAGDEASTVEHFAYLARQRTESAMQTAGLAKADEAVAQARAQRDRILIDARGREADQQRASAEKARTEAQTALKLAQQRAAAAEVARQEAEAARQQAISAQSRAAKLEAQLAEMKARKTDRGMVLTLGDVLFDTGRAELKPGAMRTIEQLATFMRENPERTVEIEGYTDSIGSDAFNQDLSERRARAVRTALIDRGIDTRRVSARGFGESNPVATNDTAAGRQQNRRVEVVISGT